MGFPADGAFTVLVKLLGVSIFFRQRRLSHHSTYIYIAALIYTHCASSFCSEGRSVHFVRMHFSRYPV